MHIKFSPAALAAVVLVFSWQPVMAQDDGDDGEASQQYTQQVEQEQAQADERNACSDSLIENVGDPDALTNMGVNPQAAQFLSRAYEKMQEDYVLLLRLQSQITALDSVKLVFLGKNDAKAQQVITNIQDGARKQMAALAGEIVNIGNFTIQIAATKCQRKQDTGSYESGITLEGGVGFGSGMDHHHHHDNDNPRGVHESHPSCIPN